MLSTRRSSRRVKEQGCSSFKLYLAILDVHYHCKDGNSRQSNDVLLAEAIQRVKNIIESDPSVLSTKIKSFPNMHQLANNNTVGIEILNSYFGLCGRSSYDSLFSEKESSTTADGGGGDNTEKKAVVEKTKSTPIHWVACIGNSDLARICIETNPQSLQEKGGKKSQLPFELALDRDNEEFLCTYFHKYPSLKMPVTYTSSTTTTSLFLSMAIQKSFNKLVTLILEKYSAEAAKSKDDISGDLAIHVAVRCFLDIKIATRLLEMYPDGASTKNNAGDLPLHVGARYLNLEIARKLIEVYSDGAGICNNIGDTPLHTVCDHGRSKGVIIPKKLWKDCIISIVELLLQTKSESAVMKNDKGRLPLHLSLLSDTVPWEVPIMLIEVFSGACKEKDDLNQRLPLHMFMLKEYYGGNKKRCMEVLLRAYPEACKAQDVKGMTPLHLSHHFMDEILSLHPESLKVKDSDGNLPLHIAIIKGYCNHQSQTFNRMVDTYPEAAKSTNANGEYPLNLAIKEWSFCSKDKEMSFLKRLLHSFPDVCKIKDCKSGQLPIHKFAEEWPYLNNGIELFANQYPQSIEVYDAKGYLPIHYVFKYYIETKSYSKHDRIYPGIMNVFKSMVKIQLKHGMHDFGRLFEPPRESISSAFSKHGKDPLWLYEDNYPCKFRAFTVFHVMLYQDYSDKEMPSLLNFIYEMVQEDCQQVLSQLLFYAIGQLSIHHIELLIQKLRSLSQYDLNQKDSDGHTALIVTIQTAAKYMGDCWDEYFCPLLALAIDNKNGDGSKTPSPVTIPDNQGRYPLHHAVETGLPWSKGTQDILKQNYDVLQEIDTLSGFYPFMAASVENKCSLSGVYELLRSSPHVIKVKSKKTTYTSTDPGKRAHSSTEDNFDTKVKRRRVA